MEAIGDAAILVAWPVMFYSERKVLSTKLFARMDQSIVLQSSNSDLGNKSPRIMVNILPSWGSLILNVCGWLACARGQSML